MQMELHTATQVQEKILEAGFRMNSYAKSYFDAMVDADVHSALYGATPEEALKVQVLYFFSNCRAMTPEQKRVKRELLEWANYRGYKGR